MKKVKADEETVPSTTAAVDGEGAAAGTEAQAGSALPAGELGSAPATVADAGSAGETGGIAPGGDGASSGDAGLDAAAGSGGPDADAGAQIADDGGLADELVDEEPEPELDVRGDPLLTLDDVAFEAEMIMMAGLTAFMKSKPNWPLFLDMHPPAKGETNPSKVLADFYVANPDAPLHAGFQQLRLKGFGSLAGAETNPAALWQFSVFRAVIDGGLAFMRAEQKELADALAAGKKPETWGGATGFKLEPGPFEATGFKAE